MGPTEPRVRTERQDAPFCHFANHTALHVQRVKKNSSGGADLIRTPSREWAVRHGFANAAKDREGIAEKTREQQNAAVANKPRKL